MSKSKIKVKEIKKDIKIVEIGKKIENVDSKESLEEKVETEEILSTSQKNITPVIVGDREQNITEETRFQVREGLKNKDKEFSYMTRDDSPKQSYDINGNNPSSFETSSRSSRLISDLQQPTMMDNLQTNNLNQRRFDARTAEPSLRDLNTQEKERSQYTGERIDDYAPKRRRE